MPEPALRVVSYNVRDLRDDQDALAQVIRSCRPDVLCLQEAPRRPFTTWRTRRLAARTGLRWVCGGRDSGGTAVFVRPEQDVERAGAIRLPVPGLFTRTRGIAWIRLRRPGASTVTVMSIHLPLDPAQRVEHCRLILDVLRDSGSAPYVIAGDLNEPPQYTDGEPGAPSWRVLAALVGQDPQVSQPTFPARAPRVRIDAVLVSADLRADLGVAGEPYGLTAQVLAAASDHLPVIGDLTPRRTVD